MKKRAIAWGWALPLGLLNGLLLWLLSDYRRFMIQVTDPSTGSEYMLLPAVLLLAAPVSAALISLFLILAGKRRPGRAVIVVLGLAAAAAYALLLFRGMWPRLFQEQYLNLMMLHLGLLAWAGVAAVALARGDGQAGRLAFLVKSLEVFVVGGLLAIIGGLFTMITFGLFDALGIQLPDWAMRLFAAGGSGLIAVIAVALVYDPAAAAREQPFDEGLSRLVALLLRLLLPLAVGVLVVYLGFIPFNWREPFENRNVLLAFSGLLFAVVALLIGVTPVHGTELGERAQTWLRRGVMALAGLTLLVGLYALAAILYRTALDRLTPNRLTFIGWDVVNIILLAAVLIGQIRAGRTRWLAAMRQAFAIGVALYLAWAAIGLLAPPWLFRSAPADVAGLPESIQYILYEQPGPILLKCENSPHIYLLEGGQKRWIKDIPTFEAQGYRWDDINQWISCDELRSVPDGVPIPPDAGPPPQP
ncbi:MAG: hypothetical protein BWY52_03319 [Chloroflexi bacterium ADurb.Bin325]|nr:MAG: hypothetical protein BWY52_03319 [Chloroflexi bacterium ADurb.Bin325]